MIRTWGFQTIGATAQPWFGDKLTAAFSNLKADNGFYFVAVAKASQYQIGDRIILGYGGANPTNCLLVEGVNTTTNILSCASEGNAPVSNWPNGTQIALDIACYGIVIQALATNTGIVYLGADSTVTAAGGSAFYELVNVGATTQPGVFSFWKYDGQNPLRTTEGWAIASAPAQSYAVSAYIN
jgi:hypothetical protein